MAPATDGTVEGGGANGFAEVLDAVGRAKIAVCTPAEGGAFIPLPAPPGQTAAAAATFRYLEGRIYEFGPCELPPTRRNELRVFRYAEAVTRDEAIRQMAGRQTRPTSSFAVGDTYEAQIWSPDPSLESPVGQAAAAVHSALGRMERSRHLDVAVLGSCPPRTGGEPNVVNIAGFAYCPANLTATVGVEVVWTNADVAPHTVTYDGPDGPVDSGSMAQGQVWGTRFGLPGTYQYYCRFHPGMRGTIVVESGP